jgi:hypothetical protein
LLGNQEGELPYLTTKVREHVNLKKHSSSQDHWLSNSTLALLEQNYMEYLCKVPSKK